MTLAEFTERLDRYGGDLSRWPAAERAAAEALLAKGPGEAWKQYRAAQLVEQILKEPVPATDHRLMDRILATAQYQPDPVVEVGALFTRWQRGMAATAICLSLLAGVLTGWSSGAGYGSLASYNEADEVEDIPGLTSSPGYTGEYL